MKHEVYLSLGSNIGNRVKNLEGTLVFLAELPETVVDSVSQYYVTEPVGVFGQRDFINCTLRLKTSLSPTELKQRTKKIEDLFGHDRSNSGAPRSVDIDLLWYDGQKVEAEGLAIPHPRMWERAFVLVPLAEIAPELIGPRGLSVREMSKDPDLISQGVQVYEPSPVDLELDRPFPGVVLAGLDPEELGHPILYKLEVESTNKELRALALDGAPEGTTLVAETQYKGKGRQGRPWVSRPFSGLWFSVLLRPGFKPAFVPSLTIVGALALARAINGFAPRGSSKAQIKWPNDILINGAKVAGCLAEAGVQGEKLSHVILGTGINVHHEHDELPELMDSITSLYLAWEKRVSRSGLLRNYLLELTALYHEYLKHGLERLVSEYEDLSCTLGRQVEVLGARPVIGAAKEITPWGSLLVEVNGVVKEVVASEVSIRNVE